MGRGRAALTFDTLGIVARDPVGDFHELVPALRAPAASRAGIAVAHVDTTTVTLDADALLIDQEPCTLAGVPALRTLILEQLGGLATVVLEQWRLTVADEHWTITATADLAAWARLADPLRAVVATIRVQP